MLFLSNKSFIINIRITINELIGILIIIYKKYFDNLILLIKSHIKTFVPNFDFYFKSTLYTEGEGYASLYNKKLKRYLREYSGFYYNFWHLMIWIISVYKYDHNLLMFALNNLHILIFSPMWEYMSCYQENF